MELKADRKFEYFVDLHGALKSIKMLNSIT